MTARTGLHVVVPGGIDDPSSPSGGNTYDLKICQGLAAAGRSVRQIPVPGPWPQPQETHRGELAGALAAIPDGAVVLLDGLVACAAPEVVVPQGERLRLVVLVHLPLADENGLAPQDAADLDRREHRTLHAAAAVVATSVATGRQLVEHHRLPAARVYVAAPGVDPAAAVPGSDAGTNLLCVAAVTARKGHDVLVEALSEVAELPWSCVCVGALHAAPGHVDRVLGLARARGLDDRVRLVGPRTGADLAATYASADLLVLASHAEPFGMVITEALARGIPVLATAVGGIPEALGYAPDGCRPGLLVEPGDPAELGSALRSWLTEPALRRRLRSAARSRRDVLPGWDQTTALLDAVLSGAVLADVERAG